MSLFSACQSNLIRTGRIFLAAAFFVVISSSCLYASPFTYNFAMTPGAGSTIGGNVSFTVDGAPATSGNTTYTGTSLEALTFNIDGQTFTLAGDPAAEVVFQNGALYDITFAQELNGSSTTNRFDLQTSGGYAFYYNNELAESAGTFALATDPSTSPVPEPGSLALFATGLLCGAGGLYRRFATPS